MLAHHISRLLSFVLLVSAHATISEIIEAHVRVINATCHDNLHHTNDCSTYTLKIGYYRCIADDKLIPGNRFEYDYGMKYKFNTSASFIFTQGLEKTGVDYIMVVVMNDNFKGFKPVTTCESTKDKSLDENRNSTVIHTRSYFSESSFFSFDIEIETVCHPSFCFGLRCDKCASYRMTTQYSSTEYITHHKTPHPHSGVTTSHHKTTTHRTTIGHHGSAATFIDYVKRLIRIGQCAF